MRHKARNNKKENLSRRQENLTDFKSQTSFVEAETTWQMKSCLWREEELQSRRKLITNMNFWVVLKDIDIDSRINKQSMDKSSPLRLNTNLTKNLIDYGVMFMDFYFLQKKEKKLNLDKTQKKLLNIFKVLQPVAIGLSSTFLPLGSCELEIARITIAHVELNMRWWEKEEVF